MTEQVIECALTVQGPNDHIGDYLGAGTVSLVALCLLLGWWILAWKEARFVRLDQQHRHMADELARLRRELDRAGQP